MKMLKDTICITMLWMILLRGKKWKGHGFPVATTNFGSIFNTFASASDGYVNASMRRFRFMGNRPTIICLQLVFT